MVYILVARVVSFVSVVGPLDMNSLRFGVIINIAMSDFRDIPKVISRHVSRPRVLPPSCLTSKSISFEVTETY